METVTQAVDNFVRATIDIEKWIVSFVNAQNTITSSIDDLETGTEESVTRALNNFRSAVITLIINTNTTAHRSTSSSTHINEFNVLGNDRFVYD